MEILLAACSRRVSIIIDLLHVPTVVYSSLTISFKSDLRAPAKRARWWIYYYFIIRLLTLRLYIITLLLDY